MKTRIVDIRHPHPELVTVITEERIKSFPPLYRVAWDYYRKANEGEWSDSCYGIDCKQRWSVMTYSKTNKKNI